MRPRVVVVVVVVVVASFVVVVVVRMMILWCVDVFFVNSSSFLVLSCAHPSPSSFKTSIKP